MMKEAVQTGVRLRRRLRVPAPTDLGIRSTDRAITTLPLHSGDQCDVVAVVGETANKRHRRSGGGRSRIGSHHPSR